MNWFSAAAPSLRETRMVLPDIRTVIAESELFARRQLRALLEQEAGVELIAECSSGLQTIDAIRDYRPDLLVMESQLPDMDGLAVLRRISPGPAPVVIFTSQRNHDAFRAFEARALDYLLKPFDAERIHIALQRVRAEMLKPKSADFASLPAETGTHKDRRRLVVRTAGRVLVLETSEVDWVEAAGNYVRLHAGPRTHLLREGIGRITARLDPAQFVRIHRSIIVNIDRIKELRPCNSGEYMVLLKDGRELSCSRSYRNQLQQAITLY
jgi:two-component system LytT family response regulator